MLMAHQPVAELWVRGQGGQLVRVGTQDPAQADGAPQRELADVVQKSAISPTALLFGGLAMGVVGGALFLLAPLSLATAIAAGTSVTVGGGLAYLGLIKRKRPPPAEQPALPQSTTSPVVIAERSRRVTVVLNQLGQATYETILKRLQWTNDALLETLVHMKDAGEVEEDLNLDTGEWIYRATEGEVLGALPAPSLSDRQEARAATDET